MGDSFRDKDCLSQIASVKDVLKDIIGNAGKLSITTSKENKKRRCAFLSANIRWMKHCSQDLNYRAKLDNLHVQT